MSEVLQLQKIISQTSGSGSSLQKLIGISPFQLIGILVFLIISIVLLLPLLSTGTVVNSGFSFLQQGVATAITQLNTLVSAGGQVLDSGFQLINSIQEQGALILSNAITSAASVFDNFATVMSNALTGLIQVGASAIAAGGQIITIALDTVTESIENVIMGISQIFFSVQSGITTWALGLVGNAISALGVVATSALGFVANVGASLINVVITLASQLTVIPLVLTVSAIRITSELAFIYPNIVLALSTGLLETLKTIFLFIPNTLIPFITEELPTLIMTPITEGFDKIKDGVKDGFTEIVNGLTGFLEGIF